MPRASKSAVVADGKSGEGESRTIGVPTGSARSRPDGIGIVRAGEVAGAGAVATARGGRGRGSRGGVIVRRADGRGAPPGPNPYSTAGGLAPAVMAVLRRVRVGMRPEGGKAVGGAGSPCREGVDKAGPVISTDLAPCEVLDVGGACWAAFVAAAGVSAEPVPPPEGTAKNEAKAMSATGNISPRPGRQSSVVTASVTRVTNLPAGAEKSSILIRGPCVRKSGNSDEAKGNPPKTALSGWGTSPLKPIPGIGEARVRSPQAQMRKVPPSSTG